jgi:YD repeat-containing protein
MKGKTLFTAMCVVMFTAACAHLASAQAPPGVFADATHPAGPPDPTKLDSIWQVDPLTGSVSITIPFTTTPAGGRGPKIPFTLHYNSASTMTLQSSGGYNIATDTQTSGFIEVYYWVPAGDPNFGPYPGPSGPWTTSGPFLYSNGSSIPDQVYTTTMGPILNLGSGCSITGPYIYTDESGAAHDMNLEWTNTAGPATGPTGYSPPCNAAYLESTTPNYTLFPSGAGPGMGSVSLTTDGSALETSSGSGGSVLYPDGTRGGTEDSNGNLASLQQSGGVFTATDSLGRAAFSTNIPIGLPGPIPARGYNVTTKGENLDSYSVVFSTIPIGSFAMPHPTNAEIGQLGFCVGSFTCPQSFQVDGEVTTPTLSAVSTITLPDSTQYKFLYDPTYGTISEIEFPTGGYVRFVWGVRANGGGYGAFSAVSTLAVTEVCISVNGNGGGIPGESCNANEIAWQYNFPSYSSTSGLTSTVTAPDGSSTAYTGADFMYSAVPLYQMGSAPSWKEATRLEYSSSGALMKSVATSYVINPQSAANGLPVQVATTLYGGPTYQQLVDYTYDSLANVIEKDESDFNQCTASCTPPVYPAAPSGGWLRKTLTSYAYATSNPAFVTAHIVDKPSQVLVTNGAGHPYSLTLYGYDETPVTGSAGIVNHDDANYPTSFNVRGNLTSEQHCSVLNNAATVTPANAVGACVGGWLKTTHTYDLTGQVTSTTPPLGAQYTTNFSYTDSYATGYASGQPQTNGYVTTVTHPYGFKDTYTYNYYPGQLATHTDWNGQTTGKFTQYLYNDPMNRITETKYPDGGDVQISYVDTPTFSVATTTKTGGTNGPIVRTTLYDGLGRKYQTQLNSDLSGWDYVNTTYDSMGRVQSVTNPFRTGDPTYGITSYQYDALGRKTFQTNPDSSVQQWCYDGYAWMGQTNCRAHTVSTVATWVDSADENGNDWQRTSDGLGRLTSVSEPNGVTQAPAMVTNYSYDPLNNLLSVAQLGGSTATGITRNRAFTYDSLSRLLSAWNPETGRVGYTYDADSNVQTKTDARNITTTYAYDALNRLLNKTYSDGATPLSCYQYDTSSATCSQSSPNWIGRLTNAWTQSASATSSCSTTASFLTKRSISCYDSMGRITQEKQYTPASQASGTIYAPLYTYDLAGNLLTSTSGGVGPTTTGTQTVTPFLFTNIYDGAGRLQTVGSSQTTNYVTGATNMFPPTLLSAQTGSTTPCPNSSSAAYSAFGGLQNAAYGLPANATAGVLALNRAYDNRLRTTCETDIGSILASPTSGSATVTITGEEQSK